MRGLMVALVLASGFALVGCGGPKSLESPVTSAQLRDDLSPTLFSTAETSEQNWNAVARSVDMDLRMLIDDFNSVFLLDRPSTLTGSPIQ
ncbi:hypothetical protein [Mucisphaera calidilacus]|uniref:Uncharacterized protein n=1 Tax=Mucisphaera calidilacus TaxID=2527982 RepID=A0A518BZD8_9BACT|nr:hypothetical protein [Mucisphaera calidilacus]QDU72343.1 hypothetical protein Pan265_22080 [Mucisphaera calidilacus]